VGNEIPESMKGFESWLLRRVAQMVEARDVPANLLTELQAEFAAARERPQAQSHADAVLDIALELAMPVEEMEAVLGAQGRRAPVPARQRTRLQRPLRGGPPVVEARDETPQVHAA
jgi:hypothetical protein